MPTSEDHRVAEAVINAVRAGKSNEAISIAKQLDISVDTVRALLLHVRSAIGQGFSKDRLLADVIAECSWLIPEPQQSRTLN